METNVQASDREEGESGALHARPSEGAATLGDSAHGGAVRRLLFATDLSPSSNWAGRVARDYAVHFGAVLHLLHVSRGPVRVAEPALEELVRALGAEGIPHVQVTREGSPAAEVVRYAAEQEMDLIIVGGHGQTGPTRALLGSVAERVSRTAHCPVLVVPPHMDARGPVAQLVLRCIVCNEESEDLVCEPCRTRIRLLEGVAPHSAPFPLQAGSLTRDDMVAVLQSSLLGRLGCHDAGKTYVVPIVYAYDSGSLWVRSGEGLKVRMMRRSPQVCLQVDHIAHLAQWKSVIVWGRFRELEGEEASAGLRRIFDRLQGWTRCAGRPSSPRPVVDPGSGHRALALGRDTIVGRIDVVEMTGRFQQG